MSIFKKSKQTSSQICINVKYKITVGEKEIEQTQYLTENYVYTEAAGKKVMYLPENDIQYIVDAEKKQLKEFDLSAQMAQINQLKAMIGELNTEEKTEEGIRHISIQNNPESPAKLKVDLQIAEYEGLEKTMFQKLNEFQQSMQMFKMNLKPNEIIKITESVLNINGQEQKSNLTLIEIKNYTESVEIFDEYFNYKII